MAQGMQTMTFLSHMQRGLAMQRGADGTVAARLTLEAGQRAEAIERALPIGGPEHVTAISPAQVIRMVPSPDSADFEPNFFAAVEFALPDLPWMFSPSGTAGDDRLTPWLALIVVPRGGGAYLHAATAAGLAQLSLNAPFDVARELPDLDEAWAWAHVQIDAAVDTGDVPDLFASAPELFRARLVCPRRLQPLTDYIACVVPITKGGVEAGLGMTPGDDPHAPAWTGSETALRLPVYHSWTFRTARRGDFEELVRRLVPIELSAGTVPLDLSAPGDPRLPEIAGASVTFKGALVGTEAPAVPWDPAHRAEWQVGMTAILATHRPGAPTDAPGYAALRDDPVVAPPLWGAYKIAATMAPDAPEEGAANDWFSVLNHHPAHRAAAGLGAESIRRNQEALMAEAWAQVEQLRAVNRTIDHTRLAAETTKALRRGKIDRMDSAEAMVLAGGAKARLGQRFAGLRAEIGADIAPEGVFTTAMARLARTRGPLGRKMSLPEPPAAATVAFFAEDTTKAVAFADFVTPAEMADTDFTAQLSPPGLDGDDKAQVQVYLAQDVVLRPLGGSAASAVAAATGDLQPISRGTQSAALGMGGTWQPAAPRSRAAPVLPLRRALRAAGTGGEAVRPPLDAVFDPVPVLRARLASKLTLPQGLAPQAGLPRPFLVTPRFDLSAYTMLRAISPETILPGIGGVPVNSVGLAVVNARFVESYLVGANAELAREFLWREYPGRLDGTYIQRFWDTPGGTADIGEIADWTGALGSHQVGPGEDGTLVLVIKGEVLARFPNLRIYASPAMWDDRLFRKEVPKAQDQYKLPLFGGWLDRSTAFFAFDLDLDEARGTLELMGPDPGWFFVFEQPPEGVQFGLDVASAESPGVPEFWADLDWSHALDDPLGQTGPAHVSVARGVGVERLPYDLDMFHETWGRSASAQARITLQRPARVLMHASGMLT